MSEPTALRTSLAFYHAWTGHDFAEAMTYVAEEIVCDAPAGRITGAAAFREFLEPFSRILTGATLLASFGDDRTALLMYDTVTVPVAHAPGAEWHTVVDGRITYIRIVFDRAPFDAARAAAR
ncbi:nuclear transport factor 2 family protein [Nocardia beijingensis]|uniref:Nuclear transport factor 2 family protein n=1 Tax=Nocardia beijingensis TaxID=95162 RepID=A0ABW7W9K6_9NOCA|nr:nuclear transport factor 2 family protein [Nocardia beijingensis]MBF6074086.1 nuclear transport factor 2 family protein [Nocardia beijingensis]